MGGLSLKLRLQKRNGIPYLIVIYGTGEWKAIEDKLKNELGLEKKEIRNGWGKGISFQAYIERHGELKDYLLRTMAEPVGGTRYSRIIDDLNTSIFDSGYFNMAIFRITPENNSISVPLEKFMTVVDMNEFAEVMVKTLRTLLGIVNNEEITIKINSMGNKHEKH